MSSAVLSSRLIYQTPVGWSTVSVLDFICLPVYLQIQPTLLVHHGSLHLIEVSITTNQSTHSVTVWIRPALLMISIASVAGINTSFIITRHQTDSQNMSSLDASKTAHLVPLSKWKHYCFHDYISFFLLQCKNNQKKTAKSTDVQPHTGASWKCF